MQTAYTHHHRVIFSETDAAGIAHFSNYFRWMEMTEALFLEKLGIALLDTGSQIQRGFPKVRVNCEYTGPLRHGDCLEIQIYLKELRSSALRYSVTFLRTMPEPRIECANGELVTTFAQLDQQSGEIKAEIIPDDLRAKLEKYL